MALSILDGTNANIDFQLGANSYKCQLASVALEFQRQLFTRITFCSTNWVNNLNGMKSINWQATGFPGKGTAASKPGQYFLTDSYPTLTFTADTGCTITFTAAVSSETLGMIAASNGSYNIGGASKADDVTVTWVIA